MPNCVSSPCSIARSVSSQPDPSTAASAAQHQSLDHQLLHNPPAAGAQRSAHGNLPLPRRARASSRLVTFTLAISHSTPAAAQRQQRLPDIVIHQRVAIARDLHRLRDRDLSDPCIARPPASGSSLHLRPRRGQLAPGRSRAIVYIVCVAVCARQVRARPAIGVHTTAPKSQGEPKSRGITPITVYGFAFTRTLRPRMPGSAAERAPPYRIAQHNRVRILPRANPPAHLQ